MFQFSGTLKFRETGLFVRMVLEIANVTQFITKLYGNRIREVGAPLSTWTAWLLASAKVK